MGNKIITEKDFWICTGGAVPAQLQTTQLSTKKISGAKYITVADKATSSWIDFGCRKLMLIMAILAAVVVVAVVATGGAALGVLIAAGAVAGAAGAAFGAVIGSLICGQKAAAAREWLNSKNDLIIQGHNAITGDDKMLCNLFGETISFAPQIKNWWQAVSLGAANYIGGIMEGAMFGAAIGFGGGVLAGGPAVLGEVGLSNLGANWLATWGGWGLGLRGLTTTQSVLGAYGNTGEVTTGDVAKGVFGMEYGSFKAAQNILTGKGTASDFVGLGLWFLPIPKNNRSAPEETRTPNEEARNEETRPDDEAPQARSADAEGAGSAGEFNAYEGGKAEYKGFGGDIILDPTKTTTVIGKFTDTVDGAGTQEILNMPEGSFTRGGENKGGINILDIPSDKYQALLDQYGEVQGKEMFWEQYNQPFLENSFKSGDNVRLLSDPSNPTNRTGFYARELREIEGYDNPDGTHQPGLAEKYGYVYDPATNTYIKK